MTMKRARVAVLLAGCLAAVLAFADGSILPPPPGAGATANAALVELGRDLFFDEALSADGRVSCASCHRPEHAFADPRPVSLGVANQRGTRNAPSIINRAYGRRFFWDGRAQTLEQQAEGPLTHPAEMGLSPRQAVATVAANPRYREAFQSHFGAQSPTFAQVTQALAAYERALVSPSPFHRWLLRKQPLTDDVERGRVLFFGKARCHLCHSGMHLTTEEFLSVGAGAGHGAQDGGRFDITMRPEDWRLFKTPSLTNVARTAPYMHDGSLATLAEVVDFYDRGGDIAENKDYRVIPLALTSHEKRDLLAFLNALTTDPLPAHLLKPSTHQPR
ncbi:MAG: hypothetical protein MUF01_16220 [Bryobacterales bacterium]|jgi:cytochrome c peroxidase|nr:hypothetical protein [Bryobacterales bacterium]